MARHSTIDLRKKKEEPEEKKVSLSEQRSPDVKSGRAAREAFGLSEQKREELISWQAVETPEYKHSREWYIGISIIATGLVVFAVILKNYFFAVFILLAVTILFVWTKQKPKRFHFAVSEKGVRAGTRSFVFSELTSFWIFEDAPYPYFVLKPKKRLSPMIHIPLGSIAAGELRLVLRPHLEEIEEQESMVDVLARLLKI